MGGPTGAAGQLETPRLPALTACCGVERFVSFSKCTQCCSRPKLDSETQAVFHDIYNVEFRSKVANNKSFQAVVVKTMQSQIQPYRRRKPTSASPRSKCFSLQPPSVTPFSDDILSVFEEWSEVAYSMISRGQNLRCFCEFLFSYP